MAAQALLALLLIVLLPPHLPSLCQYPSQRCDLTGWVGESVWDLEQPGSKVLHSPRCAAPALVTGGGKRQRSLNVAPVLRQRLIKEGVFVCVLLFTYRAYFSGYK